MSQNVRTNPLFQARALASRVPRPRSDQSRPGGVLGRLSVPQKLSLAALLLGAPFVGSAVLRVVGEMQALGTLEQHRRVQQLLLPMSDVLLNSARLRYEGTVLVQSEVNSTARLDSVDRLQKELMTSLDTLGQGLQAAGYADLATQVTALRTPFAAQKQSIDDLSIRAPAVQRSYTELIDRSVLPLFDELTLKSGLTSTDSASARSLATLTTAQLPQNVVIADTALSAFYPIIAGLGQKGALITNATRTEATVRYQFALNAFTRVQESLDRAALASAGAQRAELQRAKETLKEAGTPLMELLSSGTVSSSTLDFDRQEFMKLGETYTTALYATQQVALTALGQTLDTASARRRQSLAALILGLLVALAAAAILVTLIARSITGPLKQLQNGAQQLRDGQLSVQVPVTTSDELGELTVAFNGALNELRRNQEHSEYQLFEATQLQQHVSEFLDVTMEIADGDLTRRGAVTEDVLGNVVDSINLMTEELAQTLRSVKQASATVNDGSLAMLSSAEEIEAGTRTTVSEASRMAAQAQQLSQGIRTMAAIARASAEASRRTLAASQQGQQAVSDTLGGMDTIRMAAQETGERVLALSRRSDEIGEIVDTIAHIASQVNLLALHASIEAAGAGPAGTRFAVVAEEVRGLADESTAATARIGALIGELQGDIALVARGARENAAQVAHGVTVAGTAGERLTEISELAGITVQLAQNISTATEEQVQSVSQMSEGTRQILTVASTSQHSAAQARDSAGQLTQLARDLDTTLARFRLS
ncbi:methyl-accepting chemotaxis protein [Deinococcus rufus]|uniref:Methyl-accepting chemotaxis protein n=1 Tax=Deinococcus rufus TaxID=2136097 RepID=A0ABV7ZDF2_9DEIO